MWTNWNKLTEKALWLYEKFCGKTETRSMDGWLDRLAERATDPEYVRRKIEQQESFDYQKAYRQLMKPERKRLFLKRISVAAAVLIPLGIAVGLWQTFVPSEPGKLLNSYLPLADIRPGEHKAFLKLHSGQQLSLGRTEESWYEKNGTLLKVDSSGLHYQQAKVESEEKILYNTLVVPRGGEYFLTLGDGTKVWLNADSELKYPVSFSRKIREVRIKGEAYFEVKKAAEWPFVVKTESGNIQVIGTEFNVRRYEGTDKLIATLVKGKISCYLPEGKKILLKPHQQLVVAKGREAEIREVDPRFHIGWKDGMFQFREERLEDIMDQLSRWYDIRVFYMCEPVKNLHFSGDLSRFKSITTFIEMFEKSGAVRMTLNGKVLVIGF